MAPSRHLPSRARDRYHNYDATLPSSEPGHWLRTVRKVFRPGRAASDRGSLVVEAALVFPVLLVMSLGLAELGLLFQDALNLTTVTRSATRLASVEGRQNATNPHQYADDAAAAAGAALANVSSAGIQELWIYKADAAGLPVDNRAGSAQHGFGVDCATCWIYTWQASSRSWTLTTRGNGWPATGAGSQDACAADPPDSLGVFVKIQHRMITGIFGSATALTDYTVTRLEPVPSNAGCKG